jgi:hypothetical protein
MTDRQSQRHLYTVGQGEAKPKAFYPDGGLTSAGRPIVTNLAAGAATAGIRVDVIRHSGKLRA